LECSLINVLAQPNFIRGEKTFNDSANADTIDRLTSTNNYQSLSFASIQLLDFYQYRGINEKRRQLVDFLKNFLPLSLEYNEEFEHGAINFFSAYWNYIDLLTRLYSANELKSVIDIDKLASNFQHSIIFISNSSNMIDRPHNLGLSWNYAWVLKSLINQFSSEPEYEGNLIKLQKLYHQARRQGLRQLIQFQGHKSYDHWVPYFALYSL